MKRWEYGHGYKAFYNAILKYGWDNIKHEVLFTNLEEDRAKRIRHYKAKRIRHYKALEASYNITNGGDGYLGYNPSKETRSKISNSSKGRTHVCSEEARNKIRESHLRNIASYKSQECAILRCCKGKVKSKK